MCCISRDFLPPTPFCDAIAVSQAKCFGDHIDPIADYFFAVRGMINKLTIRYNRQRQANITKELIEIISGAEAL